MKRNFCNMVWKPLLQSRAQLKWLSSHTIFTLADMLIEGEFDGFIYADDRDDFRDKLFHGILSNLKYTTNRLFLLLCHEIK